MKYLNFRLVLSVIQTKHVVEKGFLQMTLLYTFKDILWRKFSKVADFSSIICFTSVPAPLEFVFERELLVSPPDVICKTTRNCFK